MRVGVVGAGIAGLAAARRLSELGHDVVVVEKSRGLGGRLAARRIEGTVVDHGIPALEAPDGGPVAGLVDALARHDRVALDRPDLGPDGVPRPPATPRYGWPSGMTRLPKAMAAGLEVLLGVRLAALRGGGSGIELGQDQGNTVAVVDAVIVSAPGPQAADLLDASPGGAGRAALLRTVAYDPAVMVLVGARVPPDSMWFLRQAGRGPLMSVQDESAKGRAPVDGLRPLVARVDPEASARLIDAADDAVLGEVLPALGEMLGAPAGVPAWAQVKRWRYAVARERVGFDEANPPGGRIVVCGDAVAAGPALDDVVASGLRAAEAVAG